MEKLTFRALLLITIFLIPGVLLAQFDFLPKFSGNEVISHSEFTLSYNEAYEQAVWVAYVLTSKKAGMRCERTNDFREDGAVSTGSATLSDYRGSGYDRGHLSPAADNRADCPVAMSESFFMSNMSPQKPGFNRGIWRKLESLVRDWAVKYGEIYVVTGPVFRDNIGRIGGNGVTVPGYYYKVILDLNRGEGIGFLLLHESSSQSLSSFVVSIDSVESITGLDFFPALEDGLESEVEGPPTLRLWPMKN